LLSSTEQILFIIASTLLADPVLLIPSLFSSLAINMLLAALLSTASWILFARLLLRINSKLKVKRRAQQAAMTLCMWIKSNITAHNAYQKRQTRRTYQ
jgi:ABC-type transport system involved in multi-copper enzyme maturation permease subunit